MLQQSISGVHYNMFLFVLHSREYQIEIGYTDSLVVRVACFHNAYIMSTSSHKTRNVATDPASQGNNARKSNFSLVKDENHVLSRLSLHLYSKSIFLLSHVQDLSFWHPNHVQIVWTSKENSNGFPKQDQQSQHTISRSCSSTGGRPPRQHRKKKHPKQGKVLRKILRRHRNPCPRS